MFLTRVLVGEWQVGRRDQLVPDVRVADSHQLYDSTASEAMGKSDAGPRIIVTYHDAQAYPDYLVDFEART